MNIVKALGIIFIIAGVLALVYGGFGYTRKTRCAKLGAVEFSTINKRRLSVPVWAGVTMIVVGVVLLLLPL